MGDLPSTPGVAPLSWALRHSVISPVAAALVTLTAAAAADQQWVLWVSETGSRWRTVALFPTEAACRTRGQTLLRSVATGSSREKKEVKIVDDPMPQSVGIAVIEIQRHAPPDPRRRESAAAGVAAATTSYRASLERVLAIYEREVARRSELTALRQDLYDRGVLPEHELKEAQQALADAQKNLDDTRRAIAETDRQTDEIKTQMKSDAARAGAAGSRLVQVPLYNAACWPVGVTPQ